MLRALKDSLLLAINAKLTNVGVILWCEFQTLEKHIQISIETWRILLMP